MMFDALKSRQAGVQSRRISDLFADDPARASDFSAETGDMRLDYSKTNIDADTRTALIALCDARNVAERREAMFKGQ